MKTLIVIATFVFVVAFGWMCFFFGKQSVESVFPRCQDTKLTLVASRINNQEAVCVYIESWQIKGKTKRKQYVI